MTAESDRRRALPPHPFVGSWHCRVCHQKDSGRRRRAARKAREREQRDLAQFPTALAMAEVPPALWEPLTSAYATLSGVQRRALLTLLLARATGGREKPPYEDPFGWK